MSITDVGRKGEVIARDILKNKFNVDGIFQADWMVMKDGKYYVVEVKHKEMFKAPPFDGHGLDIRQVKAREEFYKSTGIRCLFLVIDMSGNVDWQWLDVLEGKRKCTTRNGIRVYALEGFKKAPFRVKVA